MPARAREVRWAPVARTDLIALLDWIASDAPQTAAKVRDRILAAVERLSRFPHLGRGIPEFRLYGRSPVREIVVFPWRIFHQCRGNTVEILAVIDGRRNVEDLLLRRLSRREP